MGITLNEMLAMTPHLLLVIGGLVILSAQILLRKDGRTGIAANISVLTLVAALVVVVFGLTDASGVVTVLPRAFLGAETVTALNGSFRYSSFSGNALVIILSLALAIVLVMKPLLVRLNINFAENHFLILMSVAGYAYALCAEDLITLFVALELGTLPILVLIGMHRKSQAANEAAVKYLLLSAFAMAFFLLGIALLYAGNGTIRLRELKEIGPHFTKTRVVVLAYVFIFAGFFFKLAAVPMHSYIADVYEGCTTAFTTILASLSKVAAALIAFKIAMGIHDGYRQYLAPLLMAASVASMLFGAFASIGTSNLKRILAYSSVTHAGFMLALLVVPGSVDAGAMGTIKQEGGSALYIYVIGYACASLAAFSAIGYLEMKSGNADILTLDSLRPIAGEGRLLNWTLGLAVLSFMGMPPLAGFFGKFFLFKYLALSGNTALAAVAGLASGISVYAYIRVLKPLFLSDAQPAAPDQLENLTKSHAVRLVFGVLLMVLTFFAVASGFLYNTGVSAVHKIY